MYRRRGSPVNTAPRSLSPVEHGGSERGDEHDDEQHENRPSGDAADELDAHRPPVSTSRVVTPDDPAPFAMRHVTVPATALTISS